MFEILEMYGKSYPIPSKQSTNNFLFVNCTKQYRDSNNKETLQTKMFEILEIYRKGYSIPPTTWLVFVKH